MQFPSGVECSPFLPPLVAFVISALTATTGVSGAFLLLPFQVSVLGFTGPGVTPTNLIFNVVATPGGVYRYGVEKRLAWPLAWLLTAGTVPGVVLGALIRIHWLPDPRAFKLFAGCVLLYLGVRLFDVVPLKPHAAPGTPTILALALAVGLIGGIYGIGGGALIAPFLVAVARLPVHNVAGATLFATFATSAAGLAAFELLHVRPDWLLGILFGAGGLAGTYTGAQLQKRLPERALRLLLGALVTALGLTYIAQFF